MAGAVLDRAAGVARLEVRLLGPLEVWLGGRPVAVSAPRLRALLAALAVKAGRIVSVEQLARAVWGEELPEDARRAVRTYVTRLRRVLGVGWIETSADGYVLRVEPDWVDALRFVRLLEAAAATPDAAAERGVLAEALGLWRETPFEDTRSEWLAEGEGRRLTERYLAAVERRVDLDLADGRATELVAELSELVARFPLRESLWVRLLVVLARCGRQAEALERYEAIRVRLAEELGADPGQELQKVHAELLAGRPPQPGWPVGRVVLRQLPADVDSFTGRQQELASLEQLLGLGSDDGMVGSVVVSAVAGPPGVGKSALVVHAAHRVAERFPDGQLYVNLHGATAGLAPLAPLEVLGRFLRALGVEPGAIPAEVEEAAALWRSRVAGLRLLVVLDDAADAAQVRPLLPATPGCGVLVTSRRVLASLPGAHHLHLDVLAEAEAVELLGRVAGGDRVAVEPEAAGEMARLCGRLPLALRIAGARLAARPAWPIGALAERLADARRRLDELELADVGVRASFTVSYQQLQTSDDAADRQAAAAFVMLALPDGPELSIGMVARLLDVSEESAERVLERLADAHLLQAPAPGRYRLHDLLRLYARELASRHHPQDERAAALTRAVGFYAATAWQTLALLRPGDYRLQRIDHRWATGGMQFEDERSALDWLEAERANLLAAIAQAATTPGVPDELAIQLTQALFGFYVVRSLLDDRVQANQTALEVAQRTGDRAAQAQALNDLGYVYWRRGRYDQALAHHQESLVIYRELGDRRGQAISLNNLGLIHERLGRYEQALAYHQESLAIDRELGDRRGQAISLSNIGAAHQRLGRYEQALACQQGSLAIRRQLGDSDGQADSLYELGVAYRRQGRYQQALANQRESLALRRELGDPYCQAESLRELGVTLQALGRRGEARTHWLEALAIFEQLRTTDADQVRTLLAEQLSPTAE